MREAPFHKQELQNLLIDGMTSGGTGKLNIESLRVYTLQSLKFDYDLKG